MCREAIATPSLRQTGLAMFVYPGCKVYSPLMYRDYDRASRSDKICLAKPCNIDKSVNRNQTSLKHNNRE